jgi:DNA repair protein RecO (recombination protein O)
VVFGRSRTSDLHTLQEVQLVQARLGLRESYARVLAATYFCKLIELVAERETPLESLYELVKLSLDYLDQHEPSLLLVDRFERRLCELLGLGVGVQGAAVLLAEVFHRNLPPQRETLMLTLKRN